MTVNSTTHWTLSGSDGRTIYGNTDLPAGEPRGVIVLCHGFKGYKDYGFFPSLGLAAAHQGLIAHRFNFSHSGMTNDLDQFAQPELFEADTWSRQMTDLQVVSDAIDQGTLAGQGMPMAWFGHSRGAVTVLLTASRAFADPDGRMARPTAVIAAAAPDQPCHLTAQEKATLHKDGRLAVQSSRTGQTLYVGLSWLEEIEADESAFDPKQAIARIACPILLLHGTKDATVDVAASRRLAAAAGEDRARLEIIENASHTFDAPNPLNPDDALPPATARMIDLVTTFACRECAV